MLSKIKRWVNTFRLIHTDTELTSIIKSATVQEDAAAKAAVKRVRKSFQEQETAMNARALKSHAAYCKDPLTCTKKRCFKWVPDKIVSKEYEVPLNMNTDESMGDYQQEK